MLATWKFGQSKGGSVWQDIGPGRQRRLQAGLQAAWQHAAHPVLVEGGASKGDVGAHCLDCSRGQTIEVHGERCERQGPGG
jgi:hypothetical protein